jgi:DNA replication protein DnaC
MSSTSVCRRHCVSLCSVPTWDRISSPKGRSLILYGKAGRGKTHLAVAIGYRAIQNGFETLCTTAAELVEELSNASKKGRLQESC